MDTITLLGSEQLAHVATIPGQLKDTGDVHAILNHVPFRDLALFFDEFSPVVEVLSFQSVPSDFHIKKHEAFPNDQFLSHSVTCKDCFCLSYCMCDSDVNVSRKAFTPWYIVNPFV